MNSKTQGSSIEKVQQIQIRSLITALSEEFRKNPIVLLQKQFQPQTSYLKKS